MITRRNFVSHVGTGLVMASVPVSILAAGRRGKTSSVDLSSGLSSAKFNALLNENFYVSTPSDGVMVLQLVEVRAFTTHASETPTDAFSVFFEGVSSPTLADDIYSLEHGSAGGALLRLESALPSVQHARYRADCCLFA